VHDDWARLIHGTKDFGGIVPTFKFHIDREGDAGRADAADMLWRVAQKDPSHAQTFQHELTKTLDGEVIPIRRALMVGEEVPAGSGLLGPHKPMTPGLADAIKNYPQMREAYLAEFAKKQEALARKAQVPTSTQEPTRPDELDQAMPFERAGDANDIPASGYDPNRLDQTEKRYRNLGKAGHAIGLDHAADNLDHYLGGSGEAKPADPNRLRQFKPVQKGVAINEKRFEEGFVTPDIKGQPNKVFTDLSGLREGESKDISDHWDNALKPDEYKKDALQAPQDTADLLLGTGHGTLYSKGDFKARREGNVIHIEGNVGHQLQDEYDFHAGKFLADGALELEKGGRAKSYKADSPFWYRHVQGTIPIGTDGRLGKPILTWKDERR